MESPRTIRWTALFVLAVAVAATFHAPHAEDRVLCVGSDGHVDIETAAEGNCRSDHAAHHDAPATDSGEHCGDCTDIPLLDHLALTGVDKRTVAINTGAMQTAPAFCIAPPRFSSHIEHATHRGDCFSLTLKRTVSLQR